MSTIERDLTRFLTGELRVLGLAPLKTGGLLVKETIAPEKFKRTMLGVRQEEAFIESALCGQPCVHPEEDGETAEGHRRPFVRLEEAIWTIDEPTLVTELDEQRTSEGRIYQKCNNICSGKLP